MNDADSSIYSDTPNIQMLINPLHQQVGSVRGNHPPSNYVGETVECIGGMGDYATYPPPFRSSFEGHLITTSPSSSSEGATNFSSWYPISSTGFPLEPTTNVKLEHLFRSVNTRPSSQPANKRIGQALINGSQSQHQSTMLPIHSTLYNFPPDRSFVSFDTQIDPNQASHKSQNGLMELLGHVSFNNQQRQSSISTKAEVNTKRSEVGVGKLEDEALLKTMTDSAASRSSYMCRKCRAHGRLIAVRQHKRNCPYKHCNCSVCSLVNYGRHIVARQIALYRDQKNHGDGDSVGSKKVKEDQIGALTPSNVSKLDSEEDEGPHCRRCRNHGKTNPWKGHKKACPFYYCVCQQCILITLRKSNEKNLREVVQEVNKEGGVLKTPGKETTFQGGNAKLIKPPVVAETNYFQGPFTEDIDCQTPDFPTWNKTVTPSSNNELNIQTKTSRDFFWWPISSQQEAPPPVVNVLMLDKMAALQHSRDSTTIKNEITNYEGREGYFQQNPYQASGEFEECSHHTPTVGCEQSCEFYSTKAHQAAAIAAAAAAAAVAFHQEASFKQQSISNHHQHHETHHHLKPDSIGRNWQLGEVARGEYGVWNGPIDFPRTEFVEEKMKSWMFENGLKEEQSPHTVVLTQNELEDCQAGYNAMRVIQGWNQEQFQPIDSMVKSFQETS